MNTPVFLPGSDNLATRGPFQMKPWLLLPETVIQPTCALPAYFTNEKLTVKAVVGSLATKKSRRRMYLKLCSTGASLSQPNLNHPTTEAVSLWTTRHQISSTGHQVGSLVSFHSFLCDFCSCQLLNRPE